MCTDADRGRGLKNRSQDTYVRNEWPTANVVEIFFANSVKYTRASPPARKMSIIRI